MLLVMLHEGSFYGALQSLASRVVVSFADSKCSRAGAQVAPNSVLAQSSVKSSRLLNACLAAAAAFASACSTAAAMRLPFLLFKTCTCYHIEAWQIASNASRPDSYIR